jgi:hypothetical protein
LKRDALVQVEAGHVLQRGLEISQPLLLIGMKTPTSMMITPRRRSEGNQSRERTGNPSP